MLFTDLKLENLTLVNHITEKSIFNNENNLISLFIPYILKFIDMGSFVSK